MYQMQRSKMTVSLRKSMPALLACCLLLADPAPGRAATLDPVNSQILAVTGCDAAGVNGISYTVVGSDDPAPPSVDLAQQPEGSEASSLVSIGFTPPENVAVARVQIFANDSLVAESSSAPFAMSWDTAFVPRGEYLVTMKALDHSGNEQVSEALSVTVPGDVSAPNVFLTGPASATAGERLVLAALTADNVGVARVDYYLNGSLLGSTTTPPYSYTWDTIGKVGSHTLQARGSDAAGNVGTSGTLAVQVVKDTTAPSVALLAPTSNYVYGPTLKVTASASDNVGVSRMELYIDGSLKYVGFTNSLNGSWTLPIGLHILSVRAYDAVNNMRSVSRTVNRFF